MHSLIPWTHPGLPAELRLFWGILCPGLSPCPLGRQTNVHPKGRIISKMFNFASLYSSVPRAN